MADFTQAGQGIRLADAVTGVAAEAERLVEMGCGFGVVATPQISFPEVG
jgi:hypothetical protein